MTKVQIQNEIKALENTNKYFKKIFEPQDCGWMNTTIDGNKFRIKVLKEQLKAHSNGKLHKEKHWSEYL
jgi:hypothetical protein